MVKDANNLFY